MTERNPSSPLYTFFFKSNSDVQLATVLSLEDQGRQAWLGTTVVIAMNLYDLALLFIPYEITSCMLIFLFVCRSGETSFWQMAPIQLLRDCPLFKLLMIKLIKKLPQFID